MLTSDHHAFVVIVVNDLLTCYAQVLETKIVIDRKGAKGAPLKVAECIVGDATGVIVLIARNEQGG